MNARDGTTIAAGYRGTNDTSGGVVLLDVLCRKRRDGQPLEVKEGLNQLLAFRPDGKFIVAGLATSIDRPINIGCGVLAWNGDTRKRLVERPIRVKTDTFHPVAFSPDGKTIATGHHVSGLGRGDGFSFNGVALWELPPRSHLVDLPLKVSEGDVVGVADSPDGKTLAAVYFNGISGVCRALGYDLGPSGRRYGSPLPNAKLEPRRRRVSAQCPIPGGRTARPIFTRAANHPRSATRPSRFGTRTRPASASKGRTLEYAGGQPVPGPVLEATGPRSHS